MIYFSVTLQYILGASVYVQGIPSLLFIFIFINPLKEIYVKINIESWEIFSSVSFFIKFSLCKIFPQIYFVKKSIIKAQQRWLAQYSIYGDARRLPSSRQRNIISLAFKQVGHTRGSFWRL